MDLFNKLSLEDDLMSQNQLLKFLFKFLKEKLINCKYFLINSCVNLISHIIKIYVFENENKF